MRSVSTGFEPDLYAMRLTRALERADPPAQVVGVPPLFDIVFRGGEVFDYRAMPTADKAIQRRFNTALLGAGA